MSALNGGGEDIEPLVDPFLADRLRAEHSPIAGSIEQLQQHELGAGVVSGVARADHVNDRDVDTGSSRHFLAEPGAAGDDPADANDRGAEHAPHAKTSCVVRRGAGNVHGGILTGDAPLLAGGSGERNVHHVAGRQEYRLAVVARCEDRGIGGPLVRIDGDRAGLAEPQPG